ncbi:MAG TPA: prephenate dehydrogenase/arogenate dehydrogenase family protein [Longimicrobium sp.]|jgi:prephenate dehydrogenase|uniref:prephenate dehydrogenase n=1 Tax=Longimicrobium sp. TaxID=2029185 RepID=UPI002EDBB46D
MTASDPPAGIRSVAILGLGLIGGSLARDLAARGIRVLASDRDGRSVRDAMLQRIATPLVHGEQPDVVILALPVRAALEAVALMDDRFGRARLIMDVGSTKLSIVEAAEGMGLGPRFVGSHPLAGDHRSGWEASRTGLFDGARVFLAPAPSAGTEALQLARELWAMVGGVPEMIGAAEHDRRLAWTSHLPQMVSSALAAALADEGVARAELGPGGRDVTRLAGSSPAMWTDIGRDNAQEIIPALDRMVAKVREIRDALRNGDGARLQSLLTAARDWHGEEG